MAAEELNLDGPDLRPPTPGQVDAEAEQEQLRARVADLGATLAPGTTDEQLLDTILNTSPDSLIPWEQVRLPSDGLYYDWPDGIIRVRAMNQVAEKVLANPRLAQSGQSIDYLFQECCSWPSQFDASQLLLGDRTFLLYYIRGITHGNMYDFAVTCNNPQCGAVTTHTYDLNELAKTIRVANRALGPEPFKVVLPYYTEVYKRPTWVSLRFLRGFDATNILARRKVKQKVMARPGGVRTRGQGVDPRQQDAARQVADDSITDNLEKIIVSVLGDNNPFKIRRFIEGMHARDTATIREWLRANTPGIDNTVEVTCPECGTAFVMELPISEGFFRPSQSGGVRERVPAAS